MLATALFVAACVALGYWQLGRARGKQALIDEFGRGDDTVVDVTSRSVDGLPRFQSVSAQGKYVPGQQILLDNMTGAEGRPGYRVLTPFRRTAGGKLLLVDRGWVPLGETRDRLPAVDVSDDAREIAGRLDAPPAPGMRLGDATAAVGAESWPRVMNFPEAADLAAALYAPVESHIVLLHPGAPDGYERKWQPALRMNPERHLAYAIQWFALGIVAALAFVFATMRRRSSPDGRTT